MSAKRPIAFRRPPTATGDRPVCADGMSTFGTPSVEQLRSLPKRFPPEMMTGRHEVKLAHSYCVYPNLDRKSLSVKRCESVPLGFRLVSPFEAPAPENTREESCEIACAHPDSPRNSSVGGRITRIPAKSAVPRKPPPCAPRSSCRRVVPIAPALPSPHCAD